MDVRKMLKTGQLKADKIKVGGKLRRPEDGSKFTVSPDRKRKQERRKVNARARKARARNR